MSHAHSNKSGVLDAYLVSVRMDIDDDDEDIVIAMICVANEGTTPVGNLDVAIITDKGVKHTSQEGITSLGPGVERNWTFEFQQSDGEWTFSLKSDEGDLNIGPFDCEYEFQAPKGRKLGNAIGSSLFSGAFDADLGNFGQVQERELIDSSQVVLTSYVAENMEGGSTKILTDFNQDSDEEHVLSNSLEEEVVENPLSLLSPLSTPPSPPKGMPSGPPPTPPKGKPTGLAPTPPAQPLSDSPTEPLSGPPTSPPSGPPSNQISGPPSSPPSGPPSGPPSSPPAGQPTAPPAGPPTSPSPGPPVESSSAPPTSPPTSPPSESLSDLSKKDLDETKSPQNNENEQGEDLDSNNKFVVWFQNQAVFIFAGLILLFILLNLMLSIFSSGSEKLSLPGSAGEERFAGWTDIILILTIGGLIGWGIYDIPFGKDLSNKIFMFKEGGIKNFHIMLGITVILFLFFLLNLKFALFSGGSEKVSLPGSSGPAEFVGWLDLILLIGLSTNLAFIARKIK